MALTLADLQTYSGTVYTNQTRATAKLNQAIQQVADYLCFPLACYGFSEKSDNRSDATFDSISVSAVPSQGATSGSITIKKLTEKNASINVLYDTVPQVLTDAAPEVVIGTLGSGSHTIEYGRYIWDVVISDFDVSILPKDSTTLHTWHVYPYKGVDNVFLEPVNDVYEVVCIDHNDNILGDVSEWTFHNNTLRIKAPITNACDRRNIRLAILADWYLPADIETAVFDNAEALISTTATSGTLKKETIGSYSYEKFDQTGQTTFDSQKQFLGKYRICRDVL